MAFGPNFTTHQEQSYYSSTFEETEALFKRMEVLGNIGHWDFNLVTGESYWSSQISEIFGLDQRDSISGIELVNTAIHPDDKARVFGAFRQCIKSEDAFKIEMRILRPCGEIRHLLTDVALERYAKGEVLRLSGVCKDVTDQKQQEANLQQSIIQVENILKTTQDLVFLTDENGRFLQVSKSCENILGYSIPELIGKSYRDLIHPEDIQKTAEIRKSVMSGIPSSDFKNRYFKKDGSVIHLNWSANLDKTSNRVFAIARDITQLLRDKEQLISDGQKMSIVLNASPEIIWSIDRNYALITANIKFLETMKEIVNWEIQPGDNPIHKNPLPREFNLEFKPWYDRAFAGETFSVVRKTTLTSQDAYMEVYFKPIYEDEKIIAVACYSLDITKKKEKERQIQELVSRINQAQKIGKLGYWEVDLPTNETFWSEEIYNIWEIDPRNFIPNSNQLFSSIHPEDVADFSADYRNSREGNVPIDTVFRIILPSGKIKFVHARGGMEIDRDTGIKRYRGTAQDVTKEKLIEKELRDRNKFIESTLENLSLGIAVTKISTHEQTFTNSAFSKIYGWDSEIHKDVKTFYQSIFPNPEYRERITSQIQAGIQSGDLDKMSWSNISVTTQSGEERIINAKNILLPEQDLMISTVVDNTDRYWAEQALRASNERFHLATQAVSDAIWDWDIQKDECFWSEGFTKLFGLNIEKTVSSTEVWKKRVHPDDFDEVHNLMNQLLRDKEKVFFEFNYRFQRQDDSYAYVFEKVFVIRDEEGKPIRMIGAIRDITHHKMYEESLKTLNEELAESNRELEISNKELEQFAHVASHDLQEPLRMVSSFLGLLQKKYSTQLDEKGLQYIHFAVDGARRMREIILDLLEFSKVGNYHESKENANIGELVKEVLQLNKKIVQEKDAAIHVGRLPVIVCHYNSVIQLFQNLVINALKYQSEGNKPEIWIDGNELDKAWEFSVRDNGIGIDAEFYNKIFIIFERLHQKSQYSGTGIGLAICKKIVEFHGGKIWLDSKPGRGTTFHFTISKP